MVKERTALVLGATGGIGGDVARRLLGRGWSVRALLRDPSKLDRCGLVGRTVLALPGDALCAADVLRAAEGASVIVHAVNPPGYRGWDRVVLPMLDNSVAAARATGARILLPGTVYNYGPDALSDIDEDSPQNPVTRKGRIRAEMERRLRVAAEADGVPVLIVRTGDFFGPRAGNSWFAQGLVKPGRPVRSVTQPGRAGVGHQWAYLPDVAETMLRLLERADAPAGLERYHMSGHWDPDGTRMIQAIRRVVGDPALPVGTFPWRLTTLLSPVVPLFRELREMRYLWERPVRMGNRRLLAAIGEEPHTPWEDAVRATLTGLGCLADGGQRGMATVGG